MSDIITILTEARDLISSRENWTQGCPARDSKGRNVSYASREAKQFCALGAVYRAATKKRNFYIGDVTEASRILLAVSRDMYDKGIVGVNDFNYSGKENGPKDKNTHRQVLNVFDAAITQSR